jgi:uncharacterized membrane protein HdeD (DUF308 family)
MRAAAGHRTGESQLSPGNVWRCEMATANSMEGLRGPAGVAKKITGWYIAVAILFIVLGMFAIIEPGIAAIGITLLVGWLLVFGAVFHFIAAFKGGGAPHVIFQVLVGLLYILGGVYFLTHPIMGPAALTLLLAGIFLAEGVIEVISYFRHKVHSASGWLLLNGIITILLGGLIWFHWPSSTDWAIGILVGVNLLMTGFSRLMFGLAIRKLVSSTAS